MIQTNILVIDDDTRLRGLLKKYLVENGFVVATTENPKKALETLKYLVFDAIVLDQMMPEMTGTEFLQNFRKSSQTPVIMLTANAETTDRITGLELGADDYLAKPFEPKELLLRIKSLLKRTPSPALNEVNFGAFSYNKDSKILRKNDEVVSLTTSEIELLHQLANNSVIGRDDRSIDVQITRLRKKLEDDPKKPIFIQTIRGEGYKLVT